MKTRFACLISYVGSEYCGWQVQPKTSTSKKSIQECIEQSLSQVTQSDVKVMASGRTDAGVHALGQVIHFDLNVERPWEPEILQKGMNSQLPLSIRALECQKVDDSFHAISSAEKKQYSYYFQQGSVAIPHLIPFSRWIHAQLDIDQMREALVDIRGEHDFKPFQASGGETKTTIREITQVSLEPKPLIYPGGELDLNGGSLIRFQVEGRGFLKQMVRGLAGTLLEIGLHQKPKDQFRIILEAQDRSLVGPTAPARGLWLDHVRYPKSLLEWKRALS